MKHVGTTGSYDRFYSVLNFDRAGLFELIKYCKIDGKVALTLSKLRYLEWNVRTAE